MKLLVIEREKIRHNLELARQRAKGAFIYGVLKGDAYGLGLLETARLLKDEGVTRFAVGQPHEGALLRREGFLHEEILLLRSTSDPTDIDALLDAGLTATVGSRDAALALSGLAERRSTVAEAHLKIDTGMGRYGFLPEEFDKIQSVYQYMGNLAVSGVYTQINAHAKHSAVAEQMERFRTLLTKMQSAGIEPGIIHAAGSTALFRHDIPKLDAVRIGKALSGRVPVKNAGLQPVGYIECPLAELRWLSKGHTVGSSVTYTCRRPTRIGVVPVGTSDGFTVAQAKPLSLVDWRAVVPHKTTVLVGGVRARVLGQVGLEHAVIDCTDLSCSVGDIVQLEVNPLFAGRLPKKYL